LIEAPTCPGGDEPVAGSPNWEGQNISSHGLFVAGLAYAVAPDSDLSLIRVLEEDGCGTLYHIVEGIDAFMDESRAKKQDLHSTVINLSFGLHRPSPELNFALPSNIGTLERVLQGAISEGVTIVAAAGNDSYEGPPNPVREMELPAGYEYVIGVAASSIDRGRGCFSNKGDIAAPGGNGVQSGTDPCAIPACSDDPEPCLISLVYGPPAGYAYWVGTSFAAPLVSGQRALLLQATPSVGLESAVCPAATPTSLPNGIINWAKVSGAPCP
jgi:subtilisin family serine protease